MRVDGGQLAAVRAGAGSSQPSFEGYLGSGFVEFLSLIGVTGHGEFFPFGER